MIIMQYTKESSGIDIFVYDDDSVTEIDGTPLPDAIVKHNADGTISVDLDGNGIDDIQPWPVLATIRIRREEGWQGNLGWRAHILEWDDSIDPSVYALAVYSGPEGQGYLYTTGYTTGAFVFDDDEGLWGAVAPPGQEPGQADVHFGMLYASINYSNFTLFANFDEQEFQTGGGSTNLAQDLDADGHPDTIIYDDDGIIITEDDDSINIDLDSDGKSEVEIPK